MSNTESAKQKASDAAGAAEDVVEDVADHPWMRRASRAGFVMTGLIHIMLGWIAVRVATGGGGESADDSGAIGAFAEAPGGRILLWIGGIAMIALALYLFLSAWFRARLESEAKDKVKEAVKNAGKGVVYAALAVTSLRFAMGGSSDNASSTSETTATVMSNPGGRIAIVVVGLVVMGIGGYHVFSGITRKFEKELSVPGGSTGSAVTYTGMAGYIAKGIALLSVGALFGWAAIAADPDKATGMDGALKALTDLPAGTVLLILVGAGLALFGVFTILKAKYVRL